MTRRIPHEFVAIDSETVEVLVTSQFRSAMRSELVVNWGEILSRLAPDVRMEIGRAGSQLPGWHDAPTGAWVDRDGVMRVDDSAAADDEEDARRTLGPALAAGGLVLVLMGWYTGGSSQGLLIATGLAAVLFGMLLPR